MAFDARYDEYLTPTAGGCLNDDDSVAPTMATSDVDAGGSSSDGRREFLSSPIATRIVSNLISISLIRKDGIVVKREGRGTAQLPDAESLIDQQKDVKASRPSIAPLRVTFRTTPLQPGDIDGGDRVVFADRRTGLSLVNRRCVRGTMLISEGAGRLRCQRWSEQGCTLVEHNVTHTICECDRLDDEYFYAVAMDVIRERRIDGEWNGVRVHLSINEAIITSLKNIRILIVVRAYSHFIEKFEYARTNLLYKTL